VRHPIPRRDLDFDAVKIVQRLTRFDHAAYLVGGCVRDLLLGHKPKDFDIGTSATPRQIRRHFRNCRIIGRRFRLAHIYFPQGKIIEVATFRGQEDVPADGDKAELLIRDDNLFGTPEEDALRRDFTINSLFYDVNNETVLDYADGLGDLERRLVRTIGDPEIRFREDPIRILRAIKFAARLDLEIEASTLDALRRTRTDLPKAAPPRILEEINRFCRESATRKSFEWLRKTEVFEVILPELADGYAGNDAAWDYLLQLCDGLDSRPRTPRGPSTGKIFAILLIPLLAERLGWQADGRANQPRDLDVRALVDATLRPIALRLRLARKDQELCRQLLIALFRIVPTRRVRRQTRQSLPRRDFFPSLIWLLGELARIRGADFEQAHAYWTRAAEEGGSENAEPEASESEDESEGRSGSRSRGGRRRRRRSRSGDSSRGSGSERSERSSGEKPRADDRPERPARPERWDDDYFFSALPTVPEMAGDKDEKDRYGADRLAAQTSGSAEPTPSEPTPSDPPADEPPADQAPARRRRPRRRRRRRSSGSKNEGSDTENGDSNSEEPGADKPPA